MEVLISLLLKESGELLIFGYNFYGQLCLGENLNKANALFSLSMPLRGQGDHVDINTSTLLMIDKKYNK